MSSAFAPTLFGEGYGSPVWIEIDRISHMRPAIEVRASTDEDAIASFAENFDQLPPVLVVVDDEDNHWLADGSYRTRAAMRLEKGQVRCRVKRGSYVDAFAEASHANDENRAVRVTNADKRRRVEVALSHPEMSKWSSRRIAEHCGVSNRFVCDLRPESGVNGSHLEGSDGKTYPAKGKGKSSSNGPLDPDPPLDPLPDQASLWPDEEEDETESSEVLVDPDLQDGMGEAPHTCPDCGEGFDVPVWHCAGCGQHWSVSDEECRNCGPPFEEEPDPAPVQAGTRKPTRSGPRVLTLDEKRANFDNAMNKVRGTVAVLKDIESIDKNIFRWTPHQREALAYSFQCIVDNLNFAITYLRSNRA